MCVCVCVCVCVYLYYVIRVYSEVNNNGLVRLVKYDSVRLWSVELQVHNLEKCCVSSSIGLPLPIPDVGKRIGSLDLRWLIDVLH